MEAGVARLGQCQQDFLSLTLYTGLRRIECGGLRRDQIVLPGGVLRVPMTKNSKLHRLPIKVMMVATVGEKLGLGAQR